MYDHICTDISLFCWIIAIDYLLIGLKYGEEMFTCKTKFPLLVLFNKLQYFDMYLYLHDRNICSILVTDFQYWMLL